MGEKEMISRISTPSTEKKGVRAETKKRDASFLMSGHHCHNCYELFYVHSGACRFLIDENFRDLRGGDFILIPPKSLHYTRYVFGECVRTVVMFDREDISEEVQNLLPGKENFFSESVVFQVPEAWRDRIAGCLRQLVVEGKIQDQRSSAIQRLCLQEMLLLCSRVCVFLSEPPVDIHTTDREILLAAQYISEHYMDSISTADVARAAGFSPNYLSRKFRAAAGIGLHEYLVFIRLHHAAQELVSTSDSITEIALRCGFSDSNYFKDSFKKKFGTTPRNYRKGL